MQGENGFACSSCCGNDVPRPILFFVAAKKNGSACSGCRGNDLPRPILFFIAAKKNGPPAAAIAQRGPWPILIFLRQQRMVSPAAAVATTRSVSDSNLRSCKEEWPACRGRRGNDLSYLILIFVAAKKNGSPAVHPQRQPKSRLRLVRCCSDSGFHGVNLGITAGFCLLTPSCVQ